MGRKVCKIPLKFLKVKLLQYVYESYRNTELPQEKNSMEDPTESPDGEITFASMQKSYRNTELIAQ